MTRRSFNEINNGTYCGCDGSLFEWQERDVALIQRAVTGAFSLGYGYTFANNLYLGGEVGYDLFSNYGKEHSEMTHSNVTDIDARLSRQYRLSLMLGKVFANELLVYAKISGVYGKLSNDIEDYGIQTSTHYHADYQNFIYGGLLVWVSNGS